MAGNYLRYSSGVCTRPCIFFIIYINDLYDTLKSICKIFADNTKVYRSIQDEADQILIQEDLFKIGVNYGYGSFQSQRVKLFSTATLDVNIHIR